uniref:Uncharacterized protein n=1 Tax=Arion vulgaris TaxID=1028688 RepID=A0A0B7A462_9EUPU
MRVSKLEREGVYVACLLIYISQYSSGIENNILNFMTDFPDTSRDVIITSEAQCKDVIILDEDPNSKYNVQMKLNYNCSKYPEKTGFNCTINCYQNDGLALAGSQICIDVQGVPQSLPNPQFSFTVFNQYQQLKEIYTISKLLPEDDPYYVCSGESKSSLSMSLSVRRSVKMCPEMMDDMMGSNISFGSIMMRPMLPTYKLSMAECSSAIITKENAYILKVISGYNSFCKVQNLNNQSRLNTNSCIELIYVSLDFNCNISVELTHSTQSLIKFNVPLGSPAIRGQKFCKFYSSAGNDGPYDSILELKGNSKQSCIGNFAIRTTFTDIEVSDTTDDNSTDNMKQIYIAVFISLISVCLIILCVTCIFCLRLRIKRRNQRHAQQNGESID